MAVRHAAPDNLPPRTASTCTTWPWAREPPPLGGTARPTTSNSHPRHPSARTHRLRSPSAHGSRKTPAASATSILRVLLHTAKHTARPRPAVVAELMAYVPLAVAVSYLRQPEVELPLPGTGFARKIRALLAAAANKPSIRDARERAGHDSNQPLSRTSAVGNPEAVNSQMGETATH